MAWRVVRLTLVAALVSLALPAVAPTPASVAQAVHTPLGGVNVTGLTYGVSSREVDREIAWASKLDAHAIRIEIPWSTLEPSAQGQIEPNALAFTDRLIARAAADDIKVIALVQSTPCWASSAPPSLLTSCEPEHRSKANAWPPSDPSSYAAFTAFLARRYGGELAAIEVWNEPDQANENYFAGPDKAQRYAELLRAAYPAIKQADPSLPVLGGSIVGSNGAFLKALYAAGIKGYYDGLSVHFYNLVLASLRAIHEVQLASGDQTPVWLNEFGWPSCWPRQRTQQEQACVTAAVQAANVRNTFRSLARTPWVASEIVYDLQGSPRESFGVVSQAGARKPSFAALRSVLISPLGAPSPVTVHLRRRRGRVLATGSGPVGDYMQLEALRRGTPLYRAQFIMNRFNRYSVPLPRAIGTTDLEVKVFQYWMGAARGARANV